MACISSGHPHESAAVALEAHADDLHAACGFVELSIIELVVMSSVVGQGPLRIVSEHGAWGRTPTVVALGYRPRIPPNAVDCMHPTVPVHQMGVNLLCTSRIRARRTFEDFPLRFHYPLVRGKLHGICEPYLRGGAIGADEIALVNGIAHKCPLAATAATGKEELGVEGEGFPSCNGFELGVVGLRWHLDVLGENLGVSAAAQTCP